MRSPKKKKMVRDRATFKENDVKFFRIFILLVAVMLCTFLVHAGDIHYGQWTSDQVKTLIMGQAHKKVIELLGQPDVTVGEGYYYYNIKIIDSNSGREGNCIVVSWGVSGYVQEVTVSMITPIPPPLAGGGM